MKSISRLFGAAMLLMLALALTTACSEKSDDEPQKPDTPVTPETPTNPDDWQTVPASGGTVSRGDITITFPSGTFATETKVAVTEVEKGSIRQSEEASTFYQLTMPVDSRQPFTVSLKATQGEGDLVLLARSTGMDLHTWDEGTYDIPLDCTHSGDTYTATIPAFDNEGEEATQSITLGLVQSAQASNANARAATTRAETENGTISYRFDWGSRSEAQKHLELEQDIRGYLDEAISKIKALGFRVKGDRTMPVIMAEESESSFMQYYFNRSKAGEWGRCVASSSGNKWNCLVLNRQMMLSLTDPTELRKTVIHEMFHYFQFEHDPRSAWDRTHSSGKNVEYQMLIESGGAWAENLLGKGYSAVMLDNAVTAYVTFNQIVKSFHQKEGGGYSGDGTASTGLGYGLATVLHYITANTGNAKILDLYKYWNKNPGKKFDEYIDKWSQEAGHYFSQYFDYYSREMAEGKVISDLSFLKLKYNVNNNRVTGPTKYQYTDDIYKYGTRVNDYTINPAYKNSKGENSLIGDTLSVTQNEENIMTDVYLVTNKQGTLLGTATKGNPVKIYDPTVLNSGIQNNQAIAFYTLTRQTINVREEVKSDLVMEIIEGRNLKLSPKALSFDNKGGTKTVAVETNIDDITVSPNDSWLSASYEKSSKQISVTAEANSGSQRESMVIVKGGGIQDTITVTQSATVGTFDFSQCKSIFVSVNALMNVSTSRDVSTVQQGTYMVNNEFYRQQVQYSPENWNVTATQNGQTLHLEGKFHLSHQGGWVGDSWEGHTYSIDVDLSMDIDDVVNGRITNLTVKYNYDCPEMEGILNEEYEHLSTTISNLPLPGSGGSTQSDSQTTINSLSNNQLLSRNYSSPVYVTRSLAGSSDDRVVVQFKK